MASLEDPPPEEPVSRVSVVRQLEEDDDGMMSDENIDVPLSAGGSHQTHAPEQDNADIEPDLAEMEGTPGDEEAEAEAHRVDTNRSVAPAPSSSRSTAGTSARQTTGKASATPSKAPSKATSKLPSKQPTPRATPPQETGALATGVVSPPRQIHAIVPDGPKRPASGLKTKTKTAAAPVSRASTKAKATNPTPVEAAAPPPAPKAKKAPAPVPITTTPPPAESTLAANFDFDSHEAVSTLTDANRELTSLLAQRDAENAQMADALLILQSELELAEKGGGVALSKDLARKNRDAALLLNKERAQHAQAMEALKKQHAATIEEMRANGSAPSKPPSPKKSTSAFGGTARSIASVAEPASTEALESKLASVQKSYLDKVNECSALQSKMKQMARVLVREIDESLKPEEVMEDRFLGKAKGRAQKIARLGDRVRELEKTLAAAQSAAGPDARATPPPRDQPTPSGTSALDAHESSLQRMAVERKNDLAALRESCDAKQQEIDSQKKKYESLKARCKNLESDLKLVREKAGVLFEKSAEDDRLIDSLRQHIEKDKERRVASGLDAGRPSSGAAVLARQTFEAKIADQERAIEKLREELRKAQGRPRPKVPATEEQSRRIDAYVRAECETKLQLERVENDRLRGMVAQHTERMTELDRSLLAAQKRLVELESQSQARAQSHQRTSSLTAATVAKQIGGGALSRSARGNAAASGTAAAAAAPSSIDNVATLRSQLASALSEQQLIQHSYAATLAHKEQDLAILREILDQKNQLYRANIDDLRNKFAELTAAIQ